MNSVSPSITIVLHSFSDMTLLRCRIFVEASSLDIATLHPVIARRFFPRSVSGLLLKTEPPEKSPLFIRSKFAAFSLYNLALPVSGKLDQDAAADAARPNVKRVRQFCKNWFRLHSTSLLPSVVGVVSRVELDPTMLEETPLPSS